ncbi:MAG: hypothetical protein NZ480_01570 [Bdellovibrionaceae bacterium]|nr:hypothetical protein [Pseudobdellovibrionaceae bacterium]MDW8190911.1 hypothetical protein [Pseudobdellovibrionaceae bacterium]
MKTITLESGVKITQPNNSRNAMELVEILSQSLITTEELVANSLTHKQILKEEKQTNKPTASPKDQVYLLNRQMEELEEIGQEIHYLVKEISMWL